MDENGQACASGQISAPLSALLIDAPVGRHFAQLHRRSESLTGAVGQFVETGLQRGNGVVLIATALHTEALFGRLAERGIDVEGFRRCGQLVVLDADAMLARIMPGGMPDWSEFRRTIGGVLESVHEFGRPAPRVYGEMVNRLWREGRTAAAVRLEELWNELAGLYPFGLFCGYMLDSQGTGIDAMPLHENGRHHTAVPATVDDEDYRTELDEASHDIFGSPLSRLAALWIMRHVPGSSAELLERARLHDKEQLA